MTVVAAVAATIAAGVLAGPAGAAATPPSGAIDVCKNAGPGIASGETFTFTITLSGVTRVLTVPAGGCERLEVPRDDAVSTKGYYRNHPDEVVRLVPAAAKLVVDGQQLTASQIQAVLDGGSSVSAQTSLVLNLAQQLLAADLNILRGAVPPAQAAQAVADANAAVQIAVGATGELQLATTLSTPQVSALVKTLTAFNERKLRGPATPSTATLRVVESIPADVEVTAIACDPSAACSNVNVSGGSVDAAVTAGSTTTATFTNRSTLGTLRLCKASGTGVAAGTAFTFLTPDGDREVAAGACLDLLLPEVNADDSDGRYGVFEYGCGANCLGGDQGFVVASIVCDPAPRCSSTSESVGTTRVGLAGGETTTVTFTNRSSRGTLRLCKAAGTGIQVGSLFRFRGPDGNDRIVTAGGACAEYVLPEVAAGNSDGRYEVAEYGCGAGCLGGDLGHAVVSIVCDPAPLCSSTSELLGVTRVGLVGGQTTTVTFTNRSSRGTLRLCKAAGAGIAPGTVFTFLTPVGDRQVAAGACLDLVLPDVNAGDSDGRYAVFEYGCGASCLGSDQGFVVASIVCDAVASCSSTSEALGTTRVGLVGGGITTVTFTNRSST